MICDAISPAFSVGGQRWMSLQRAALGWRWSTKHLGERDVGPLTVRKQPTDDENDLEKAKSNKNDLKKDDKTLCQRLGLFGIVDVFWSIPKGGGMSGCQRSSSFRCETMRCDQIFNDAFPDGFAWEVLEVTWCNLKLKDARSMESL